MIIEPAKKEYLPQILELNRDLIGHNFQIDKIETRYEMLLSRPDHILLTAVEDGQVLGVTQVIICHSVIEDFLVIEDVVVNKEIRGKGIGRAIFAKIDEIAKENHCSYSILVSSGFRKGAHTFYEKMGYLDDVRGFRKVYFEI